MATERQSSPAVEKISSLATACRVLFRKTRTAPWLTEANARLEEVAQRFDAWVSYLGVLAVGNASLDYRLRLVEEIRVMVVDLLLLLERNLIRRKYLTLYCPAVLILTPTQSSRLHWMIYSGLWIPFVAA